MSDIKLKSLHLVNFKKHADVFIEFSDTLTVIRGPNWAGKSSLLHGVFFALFGATAVPGKKERIVRRGEKKCEVELVVEDSHQNVITIKRSLTAAAVHIDGEIAATGHTAVNTWIEDTLLEMDQKRALTLAYSPQSKTAALLTLGAPMLNRMIEEMSQADHVEKVIVAAGARVKKANDQLEALGPVADITELQEQQVELSNTVVRLDAVLVDNTARRNAARASLTEVTANIRQAEALNTKLATYAQKRADLTSTQAYIADVLAEMAKSPDTDTAALAANSAKANLALQGLETTHAQQQADQRRIDALTQWFATTGASWEESEKYVEQHDKALEKVKTLEEKESNAKNAWTQMNSEVLKYTKAAHDASCHACNRPYDAALLQQAQAKLELAKTEAAARLLAHQAATEALVAGRTEAKRLGLLRPPAGYETTYAEKAEELEGFQAKNYPEEGEFVRQLAEARQAAQKASQALADAQAQQTTRTAAQNKLDRIRVQERTLLEALADAPAGEVTDLTALRTEAASFQTHLDEWAEVIQANQLERTQAQVTLRNVEKQIEIIKATAERRQSYETTITRYGALQKWLRESKAKFLGEIWDGILALGSEFVSAATMGYATEINRSDDGEFSLIEEGEEGPMESASGGMQAVCGVALRLALPSLMPRGLGFVILDEPSSELNDENAASLAGALRTQNRQVILVTHREGEEFMSDSVVML